MFEDQCSTPQNTINYKTFVNLGSLSHVFDDKVKVFQVLFNSQDHIVKGPQHFPLVRLDLRVYLFIWVLHGFQHCTCHIMTGSWRKPVHTVLYCKLATNGKQLLAFPLVARPGTEPRPQRWEARVLPLCHCGPLCGT